METYKVRQTYPVPSVFVKQKLNNKKFPRRSLPQAFAVQKLGKQPKVATFDILSAPSAPPAFAVAAILGCFSPAGALTAFRILSFLSGYYLKKYREFPLRKFPFLSCWADRIRTCGMRAPKARVLPLDDGPIYIIRNRFSLLLHQFQYDQHCIQKEFWSAFRF